MKRTLTLSSVLGVVLLGFLTSNTSGPAHSGNGNKTGGPGSTGTCMNCHSNSMSTTSMQIDLLNKTDLSPATGSYVPGNDYIVSIKGSHVTLTQFGFQLMAIKSDRSNAGSFSAFSPGVHQMTIQGQTLVEHAQRLTADQNMEIARFEWTAPPPGSGTVSFHGILNAVNGDNNSTGDASGSPVSLSFSEATTFVADLVDPIGSYKLYPNPAHTHLIWESQVSLSSPLLQVFDLSGKLIRTFPVSQTEPRLRIDISDWEPGFYFIQYTTIQGSQKAGFLKN